MLVLEIACPRGEKDRAIAELYELGTLGIIEREDGLVAYFGDGAPAAALAERLAAFAPRFRQEPEAGWGERWREQWRSQQIGKRLFLSPEWSAEPVPEGRIRLSLRPGQACGTGLHPCTLLCLEWLEKAL
ncbi:MAG: 50S ribosomal protein L11 methyltransferase, partial [Bryobacteraceae bacterium]